MRLATSTVRPVACSGFWRGVAWEAIVVVGNGVLAWGTVAIVDPVVLTAWFEAHTASTWAGCASGNVVAAGFVLARLIGALNVAVGVDAVGRL